MIKSGTTLCLFLSIAILSSCTPNNEFSKEKMKVIVKKQNELLKKYFITGNADKLASLYTENAKLSPNGGDFIIGRDSISAFWREDFKSSKLLSMTTNVLTTDGTESVIYETGKTTTKTLYQDSIYTFTVKYVNVWLKQTNGSYKLDIDFWNKDK